jgi:hypothetical protein
MMSRSDHVPANRHRRSEFRPSTVTSPATLISYMLPRKIYRRNDIKPVRCPDRFAHGPVVRAGFVQIHKENQARRLCNITDSEYRASSVREYKYIPRFNVSTNWPEFQGRLALARFCSLLVVLVPQTLCLGHRGLRGFLCPLSNFAVMIARAWRVYLYYSKPARTSRASRRPFPEKTSPGPAPRSGGAPLGDWVGFVVSLLFLVLAFASGPHRGHGPD